MTTYKFMPKDKEDQYEELLNSKRWSFLTDLDEMLALTIEKYEYCVENQRHPCYCLFCSAGNNDMEDDYIDIPQIPDRVTECDYCYYYRYTGVSCKEEESPYEEGDFPQILEQLKNMRADRLKRGIYLRYLMKLTSK